MIRAIPNVLTLLNLFCGCIAIVLIFNGAYTHASVLIFTASVFDFLDGTAARLLDARSEIGKQLDSLADVVSFGVAPAGLMFMLMSDALNTGEQLLLYPAAVPAFTIALFSALRLAKFNIDDTQTDSFKGLPTPANALFIASFPFIILQGSSEFIATALIAEALSNYYILLIISIILSFMLVSGIPLMGLKFKSLKWKGNQYKLIFLIISLLMIVLADFTAAPFVFAFYVFLSAAEHWQHKYTESGS